MDDKDYNWWEGEPEWVEYPKARRDVLKYYDEKTRVANERGFVNMLDYKEWSAISYPFTILGRRYYLYKDVIYYFVGSGEGDGMLYKASTLKEFQKDIGKFLEGEPSHREMSLAAILSVTTGKMLCDFAEVCALLRYVSGETVTFDNLGSLKRSIASFLLEKFPELGDVNAKGVTGLNWKSFVAAQIQKFGKSRVVPRKGVKSK